MEDHLAGGPEVRFEMRPRGGERSRTALFTSGILSGVATRRTKSRRTCRPRLTKACPPFGPRASTRPSSSRTRRRRPRPSTSSSSRTWWGRRSSPRTPSSSTTSPSTRCARGSRKMRRGFQSAEVRQVPIARARRYLLSTVRNSPNLIVHLQFKYCQ